MNQNKLRNKLENRNIQPSENAWLKLESKLENSSSEIVPVKRKYFRMIAAVLIGLAGLFVAGYFFLDNNQNEKDLIVENSTTEIKNKLSPATIDTQNIALSSEKNETILQKKKTKIAINLKEKNSEKIFSQEKKQSQTEENKSSAEENKNDFQPKNIASNVAKPKQELNAEMETNLLLNNAMNELRQKKQRNVLTQAKASILLDDVENDIQKDNQTIKSKIYKEIDKKYYQIKTVLTDK